MKKLEKVKDIVIYKDTNGYNTFPNIIQLKNKDLMVSFRSAPEWQYRFDDVTHCDPASKGVYVTSKDGGQTWDDKPSIIYDDFFYGVQDPCLNILSDNTIVSSFFMWKVWEKQDYPGDASLLHQMFGRYSGEMKDLWTTRSYDNGRTWDGPINVDFEGKTTMNSARGNMIEESDGSLLFAVSKYGQRPDDRTVLILRSQDQGKTWKKLSDIPRVENATLMGEPNLFQTQNKQLVCMIRTHMDPEGKVYQDGEKQLSPMHICFSKDGGKTWSYPKATPYYSPSPFEAIQLKSGNVLMTYGHRYSPYGIKAVLLDGTFENIEDAPTFMIREDGVNHDLGYTRSIQLDNGDILVVYYLFDKNDGIRYIAGTFLREV